ncbi:capsule biosynthesis protein [Pseudomonas sp. TE3610]
MSTSIVENDQAWRAKAKALDRYRWKVLRANHSFLGCLLRAAREYAWDVYLGVLARLGAHATLESASQSIVMLHGTPKVLAMGRKKGLIDSLVNRGHEVVEVAIAPLGQAVRERLICRPPQKVPLRYYAHAGYAEWLSRNSNPRLILGDRNGSLVSPFLRLSMNAQDKRLVHLAHATTLESSRRLGMIDYDFYLLFGESSLSKLRTRPLLFGEAEVVLSGSHLVDHSYVMPPSVADAGTVLILGVGPDKEKRDGYLKTYELLKAWIAANPQVPVSFKPHYRSKVGFWLEAGKQLANLTVTAPDLNLADALQGASVVINIMSNAALEASLAQRPVMYVNASGDHDVLEQARFFGGLIDTQDKLETRLEWVRNNYCKAVEQSKAFADYHLVGGVEGLDSTVSVIDRIWQGKEVDSQALRGNF